MSRRAHQIAFAPALLLATMTLLAGCSRGAPAGQPLSVGEARDSVIAVLERLTLASVAKDLDAFMALWEHSDSVVYSRHGRTFVGWDEIRSEHARAFSGSEPWSFEAGAVHARALGPRAGVGTAFVRLSSPSDSNWFIITLSIEASEDGWRVVQGHGSYPPSGTTPRGEAEEGGP